MAFAVGKQARPGRVPAPHRMDVAPQPSDEDPLDDPCRRPLDGHDRAVDLGQDGIPVRIGVRRVLEGVGDIRFARHLTTAVFQGAGSPQAGDGSVVAAGPGEAPEGQPGDSRRLGDDHGSAGISVGGRCGIGHAANGLQGK